MQNVARIPEFEQLWKDILQNPKTLLTTFSGVWQMLSIRTSRRFLQCRVTPDVERKMHFFTSSVKFGSHKRYQDWFQEKYFATPESHSLRSDLIRFIVNVIHPTNDMLCSDLIPRWAIIGWLLTSCTNPTALANAKLALFYDWLFFDPIKDNIMNVEPGILVMYHSIRNHPLVSSTLLDFLCRIIKHFFPKSEDRIRAGVFNSLRKILEKQVIPNLYPLFESQKLDQELRTTIRENFREFCTGTIGGPPIDCNNVIDITNQYYTGGDENRMQAQQHAQMMVENDRGGGVGSPLQTSDTIDISCDKSNAAEIEPKFSDDENDDGADKISVKNEETDEDDDLPLSKVRLKEKPLPEKVDLPASISNSFEKFITEKTTPSFDAFLSELRTCTSLDGEQEQYIVANITHIVKTTLPANKTIFPDTKNDEKLLALSISYPMFSIFKIMYQYEEKLKKCFQNILKLIFGRLSSAGYMLLYFLKVHTKLLLRKNSQSNVSFKTNLYRTLCDHLDQKVDGCLAKDLCQLESESSQMFLWILPDMFREFKSNMINNSEVLRIVVGSVDAKSLRDLIYSVTQGKLTIFKNDGVLNCVRESLTYETFEQFCFWQLVQAHDVPIENLQVCV